MYWIGVILIILILVDIDIKIGNLFKSALIVIQLLNEKRR